MVGLIPLPSSDGRERALWVNPDHVTSVAPLIDRTVHPARLIVELKLQGLNLSRHQVATGTDSELEQAWMSFLALLAGDD